jgi:hypothetical protein
MKKQAMSNHGMADASVTHDNIAMKGLDQGNMEPHVADLQRPMSEFSQENFGKTLDYIGRHNKFESKEASEIKGQAYQGRYS